MDPITVIVAALVAGAAAGAQGLASDVLKDSYVSLKALLRRRFQDEATHKGVPTTGTGAAVEPEAVLRAHEVDPDTWERPMRDVLQLTGAGEDVEVVAAAQAVLDVAGGGGEPGKYRVDVRGAQGVQVGDHAIMTNMIGVTPTKPFSS